MYEKATKFIQVYEYLSSFTFAYRVSTNHHAINGANKGNRINLGSKM